MNAEGQDKIISGIAKVIVNNREELIKKLDELEIACSCGMGDATEKDLSDIIVDNIENKKLQLWLAEKIYAQSSGEKAEAEGGGKGGGDIVSAIAKAVASIFQTIGAGVEARKEKLGAKAEYKKLITTEAVKFKQEQERGKRIERTTNTLMIAGGALLLVGVGALIYFGTMKGQKSQVATA